MIVWWCKIKECPVLACWLMTQSLSKQLKAICSLKIMLTWLLNALMMKHSLLNSSQLSSNTASSQDLKRVSISIKVLRVVMLIASSNPKWSNRSWDTSGVWLESMLIFKEWFLLHSWLCSSYTKFSQWTTLFLWSLYWFLDSSSWWLNFSRFTWTSFLTSRTSGIYSISLEVSLQ